MEFVREFAIFLHKKEIIRFGDFTLASGKKSSYYVDLRLVPSYPIQFRKMIKYLQNQIIDQINLEKIDSLVSVPTGGLIVASALACETVKPLIYVRSKPKEYGTNKMIEGKIREKMKVIMIDDVATTGSSVLNAVRVLKEEKIIVKDAFVIVDRIEGAVKSLKKEGIKMHSVIDVMQVTEILYKENLINKHILEKVREQTIH